MITKDMVVSLNYTLKDEAGNILDSSSGEPLEYLQGYQNIIPGLERELNGLNTGERKHVVVSPEEGYGQYDPDLKFALSMEQFGDQSPQEGMLVQMETEDGIMTAKILGVEGEKVILDANHPLAGKSLFFDVEISGIRPATSEEIAHGHPHGPHSHHH